MLDFYYVFVVIFLRWFKRISLLEVSYHGLQCWDETFVYHSSPSDAERL